MYDSLYQMDTGVAMEFIVIWLVLSVFVGVLASSYGRSGVGWFALSAVLSPLLAGIGLLASGRKKADAGPVKKCPECAETVASEARTCKHCGYRFAPPETAEEAALRAHKESTRLRNRRFLGFVIIAVLVYIGYAGAT